MTLMKPYSFPPFNFCSIVELLTYPSTLSLLASVYLFVLSRTETLYLVHLN
ncbi:hypothetical protein BU600_03400 [Staphylococcus arlettae]|nr:hypothetical protein CD036_12840 [Staphylococcus arlettae]PTH22773.1 hypothetical protein BU602_06935 [Staphylococcus arlettae]PTH26630.1 hypothetical protein BU605_06795 [Staphylococcus arlettae]PTH31754.1 hypothetical protein BU592_10820 [Staphylococcus arlettae]PTH47104.1 hypothetical protein BU596_04405 [Staphylococcus arlettae]